MLNKTLFKSFITLMITSRVWAMEHSTETHLPIVTISPKILCSRLTLEDHRKLATESEINLMKKNLSDGDLKTLLPLMQGNPSLTKLDLFKNNIGSAGAKILASLTILTNLNLEENKIGDEGAGAFEFNTTLKTLNLFKNGITDLGVIPLARNTTLQDLGLYSNEITDFGAFAFAANRSLRRLDLRRNQIGDKGTQAIASNQTLEVIFLGRNPVTDVGAKAFLYKDNFTHVDLKDTKVSEEAIKLFEQAFPHNGFLIRIRHDLAPRLAPSNLLSSSKLLPLKGDTVYLLSIDGGGIRGLIPACILQHLEEKLARKLKAPCPLVQGFDWMAGTSTGGLIALGLNVPRKDDPTQSQYPVSELVNLYEKFGPQIFPKSWNFGIFQSTYKPQPLEELLKQYFGDFYLSESIGNVLITAFNMGEDSPHVFNSLKARKNPHKDFFVRSAARATSAAPTYFPAAQVKNRQGKSYSFIDGGVYANNPSAIGVRHVQKLYPHAKKIVVLSLGTGEQIADRTMTRLNSSGKLGWATEVTDHLMKNAAKVVQETLQAQIQQDPRIEYIRIQATLANSETGMDNVSDQNIQSLLDAAQTTIRNHKKEIKQITSLLMQKFANVSGILSNK